MGEVLFRPHSIGLDIGEAMEKVVPIKNREDLIIHLQKKFFPKGKVVTDEDVTIMPYGYDERINWNTYKVILTGVGVVGFTNGPLEKKTEEKDDLYRLHGDPCVGCGFCCVNFQCALSLRLHGDKRPCPELQWDGSRHYCRAVFQIGGIGTGCPSSSMNTWRAEIKDRTQG